jgi:hypothetical protein
VSRWERLLNQAVNQSPLRWPLAAAALTFFAVAIGLSIEHDEVEILTYASIIIGSVLIGAWIVSLGSHDYSGESDVEPPDDDQG